MDYTDEELDVLHDDSLMNSGDGVFCGNPATLKTASLSQMRAELQFSENAEVFADLRSCIANKSSISLNFEIKNGCPYYQFEVPPHKANTVS